MASGVPSPTRARDTDVEKLLSDLDNLAPLGAHPPDGRHPVPTVVAPAAADAPDAQSLLDDLDSLVQRRPQTRPPSRGLPPSPAALTPTKVAAPRASISSSAARVPVSPVPAAASPLAHTPSSAPAHDLTLSTSPSPSPSRPPPGHGPASGSTASAPPTSASAEDAQQAKPSWGGWGSMWNQATRLADQARAELEKHTSAELAAAREAAEGKRLADLSALGGALGARGWGLAQNVRHYVQEQSGLDLEKIGSQVTEAGRRGLNDLIQAVSAPVAEHDILQVQVSHDMDGYEGIVDVVFQTMARVLEQHASDSAIEHHLIADRVFLGSDDQQSAPKERNLHTVDGLDEGVRQAEVIIRKLVQESSASGPSDPSQKEKAKIDEIMLSAQPPNELTGAAKTEVSTSTDTIYLRLQPAYAPLPWTPGKAPAGKGGDNLFFILHLHDPAHDLTFVTLSQPIPASFFDVPFEENVWVEQSLTDVVEVCVGVLTHDYIRARLALRNAEQDEKQAAELANPTA